LRDNASTNKINGLQGVALPKAGQIGANMREIAKASRDFRMWFHR